MPKEKEPGDSTQVKHSHAKKCYLCHRPLFGPETDHKNADGSVTKFFYKMAVRDTGRFERYCWECVNNPCKTCPVKEKSCYNEYTDIRGQCLAYAEYLGKLETGGEYAAE
jgi:hypothetical protein